MSCTSCGREMRLVAKGLCKACYDRQAREKNPELAKRHAERGRRWRERNPERCNFLNRRWREENPEKERAQQKVRNLRYKLKTYGLTEAAFRELMDRPCAICGVDLDLVIDHDHETGQVRGALCRQHNAALGQFGDDVKLLERAVMYLRGEF